MVIHRFSGVREVYAVGWTEAHERRAGNSRLLGEGAQPITGPDQVPAVSEALHLHKQKMERQQAIAATGAGQGALEARFYGHH